jgi:hypothetical protein
MDLFVVPTIGFDLLYALVIVRLDGRQLVWINVTQHPTAEWIARQRTEAFPMRHHTTSCGIGTAAMATLHYADCVPWAFATSPSHQRHLGRTALPKG